MQNSEDRYKAATKETRPVWRVFSLPCVPVRSEARRAGALLIVAQLIRLSDPVPADRPAGLILNTGSIPSEKPMVLQINNQWFFSPVSMVISAGFHRFPSVYKKGLFIPVLIRAEGAEIVTKNKKIGLCVTKLSPFRVF